MMQRFMVRMILPLAALSMSACTHHINIDRGELDNARAAIAAAKAAGAEECAPKLQAQAVAALYWAAHELTEDGYHPDENAEIIAQAEGKAKAAHQKALKGCGAPEAVKTAEVIEIIELEGVYFDTDSSNLRSVSISALDRGVATLMRRNDIRVEVAAHTDSRATDKYNLWLSDRRAAKVKKYLISHGISASRLISKGYGESHPVADNKTAAGQAKNRRVELRVLAQ